MYSRILVGHDLDEGGDDALALARVIADALGSELIVAGIFPLDGLAHGFGHAWHGDETELAERLEMAASTAGARAEAFPAASPGQGLHDLAVEIGADLVVVGSCHRGRLGEALAGNVALSLMHGSSFGVALAPRGYRHDGSTDVGTVVVGLDGSPESRFALEDGIELALAAGARLKLVAVAENHSLGYGAGSATAQEIQLAIEAEARRTIDGALESVPSDLQAEATLVTGDPAMRLADAAGAPGSVLMTGSRGYGPVRRVLLGSVSARLVRSSPSPVLVRPRGRRVAGNEELTR